MEKFKKIAGVMLLSYALIGGLIFYLGYFKSPHKYRHIFKEGALLFEYDSTPFLSDSKYKKGYIGGGASNTPIYLGLCGLAGAYLLANTKNTERKKG